jgi:Uma2 family endonuclease
MTMSHSSPRLDPSFPAERIRRLTVAEYRRMAQAGILTPDDRVELLEGWLVEKMTKNPPHRIATRRTRVALEAIVTAGWYVDTQEPIVTEDSEPEPDVAVIRGRTEDYLDRNPGAENVALIVEIADASLRSDRGRKARIYARAAVPVFWILDLTDRQLVVHTDPTGSSPEPEYRVKNTYGADDLVGVVVDGTEIGSVRVTALLPE